MHKRYGITPTDDGFFVLTCLQYNRDGWKIKKTSRWNSQSFIHNFSLFHRPVALTLPSRWIRILPEKTTNLLAVKKDDSFTASTNMLEFEHYSGLLQNNLVSTYPDDALLVSIPQNFLNDVPDSFIALFTTDNEIRLGVVIEGTLNAVFPIHVTTPEEFTGYLGRIKRYWETQFPSQQYPTEMYSLNECSLIDTENTSVHRISCGSDDPSVLKTVGGALCDISPSIPQFSEKTVSSSFRYIRMLILLLSLLSVLLSSLFSATLYGLSLNKRRQVAALNKTYNDILNNNSEIRNLIKTGNELSEKVLQVNEQIRHPTAWSRLLHIIGSNRPEGLFLERLGSEPIDGNGNQMKIAFSGWCNNETIATDYIKSLSSVSVLSDVTLASMERDKRQPNIFQFKILCKLIH